MQNTLPLLSGVPEGIGRGECQLLHRRLGEQGVETLLDEREELLDYYSTHLDEGF